MGQSAHPAKPDRQLTSLSHHIDMDWMYEAYRVTRKDGAVGIDGQSSRVPSTA